MLASSDSAAYWRAPDIAGTPAERPQTAFREHWFGIKSEARVRTLLGDMALRFDAYPSALRALRAWRPEARLAPWLCHFHTQLADPIYRRFTGDYLPSRIELGYLNVDRDAVARWVSETWPGRWSPATCLKFGSNLLATAHEAGLIEARKDPRPLSAPRPPKQAFEYMLYLLRDVEISGGLLDSPYFRSVASNSDMSAEMFRRLDGVRLEALGDVQNLSFSYPTLDEWVMAQRQAA